MKKHPRTHYRINTQFALTLCLVASLSGTPARAQQGKPTTDSSQTPKTSPANSAGTADKPRTVSLTPVRAGNYSYWITTKSGLGTMMNVTPDQSNVDVKLPSDATIINVIDNNNGTVALYSASALKNHALIPVAPDDFKRLHRVQVTIVGKNNAPVSEAKVSLKDSKNPIQEHTLTPADKGVAAFENVFIGSVTVTTVSGSARASSNVVVTPVQGNAPFEITLSLSGNVPVTTNSTEKTVGAGNPVRNETAPAAKGETPSPEAATTPHNDWLSGVIGVVLFGGLIYVGYRYAKANGITLPGVLKKLGVELPQDAQETGTGHLIPAKVVPVQPPLADLSGLPTPETVPVGGVPSSSNFGTAPLASPGTPATLSRPNRPRLVGVAGVVTGKSFPIEGDAEGFTIGRDPVNSLPLVDDNTISRSHASIVPSGSGWAVVDQGSSNGTFVNGKRNTNGQLLHHGDEIQVGASRFRFEE